MFYLIWRYTFFQRKVYVQCKIMKLVVKSGLWIFQVEHKTQTPSQVYISYCIFQNHVNSEEQNQTNFLSFINHGYDESQWWILKNWNHKKGPVKVDFVSRKDHIDDWQQSKMKTFSWDFISKLTCFWKLQ